MILKRICQWMVAVACAVGVHAQTVSPVGVVGLTDPYGVVVDVSSNLYYLSNAGTHSILRYDPATGETINFSDRNWFNPQSIILARGGMVISDSGNHVIRYLGFDGLDGLMAGSGKSGNVNGTGASASFNAPSGLAVDNAGNIYVADTLNNSIRRIASDNSVISYAIGFNRPSGLAMGENGQLFVADTLNHVIKIVDTNQVARIIAGSYRVPGYTDAGSGVAAEFDSPSGLLWIGGNTGLLVCDTANNRIRRVFQPAGRTTWSVETFAAGSSFKVPVAMAADQTGTLLVTEGTPADALVAIRRTALPAIDWKNPTGVFSNAVVLAVNNPAGVVTRYTTDNSTPTPFSPILTNGTVLNGGPVVTLALRNFSLDNLASPVVSNLVYTFTAAAATVDPAGAVATNRVLVNLTTPTTNSVIIYTTDGSEPSLSNGFAFLGVLPIDGNTLLRTKVVRAGFQDSVVTSNTFVFSVATPTIVAAGGSGDNQIPVTLTSATTGAQIVYTLDGTEPSTTNGVLYTAPFILTANPAKPAPLTVRAFKPGYAASDRVTFNYRFKVADPMLTPPGGNYSEVISLYAVSSTTNAQLRFTLDGSIPTTNSPQLSPLVTNAYAATGLLSVRAFVDGFDPSEVVSNRYVFTTATPTIRATSFATGSFFFDGVTNQLSTTTSNAVFYYTLDGTDPTLNLAGRFTNFGTPLITRSNVSLVVVASRLPFAPSTLASTNIQVKVSQPVMSPSSGYFPQGVNVTLSVPANPIARIYYRLDGASPTTNDTLYTGAIRLDPLNNPGGDLRVVSARAFVDGATPSEVTTGSAVSSNTIGVAQSMVGGIGSTIVIPVVANLQSGVNLKSLQFRVHYARTATTAPNVSGDVRTLPIGTNDFLTLVAPSVGASTAQFTTSPFNITGAGGTITNVLLISAIGTNANVSFKDFATVTLLAVTIPATASEGDKYSIEVRQASGTTDGQQNSVNLTALAAATITVSNRTYVVGDTAPGHWYNAGDFGNGDLDNADVNNAFYASLGIRLPFTFTDAFDAMDAFPDDTIASIGGDGQIRFLDWQRILRRSLRRDATNWKRSWSVGGERVASLATLTGLAVGPGDSFDSSVHVSVLNPQVEMRAGLVNNARSGDPVKVPIYVKVKAGSSVAGLQFRARVAAVGTAPGVASAVTFESADGIPAPIMPDGLGGGQAGVAWSLLLNPFRTALTGEKLLGNLVFNLPGGANNGDRYQVLLLNADASPDDNTAYDVSTVPGGVAVNAIARVDRSLLAGVRMSWYAAAGQRYQIESTQDLINGPWVAEGIEIYGRGRTQEFVDQSPNGQTKFYRIRPLQ